MYGVKIILKAHIDEKPEEMWFEEIILAVDTEDVDDAFEKAENYAKGYCVDYKNCYDETVKTEIYATLDAFEAFEPENGVQEIYSKHYKFDGRETEREDMLRLLNREFNQGGIFRG